MTAAPSGAGPVPVLVLIFNRAGHAARCVRAIAASRPARLYLAADGPRPGHADDGPRCEQARRAAVEAIDWPCEVRTLFRAENLGCARAVHGALDWFFGQEPAGIVLEDDCLASPAFFPYCAELLDRYRDEPGVFAISGDNFVEPATPEQPSYWFTRVFHVWGWATWRDRWARVPLTVGEPGAAAIRRALRGAGLPAHEVAYWTPIFDRVRDATPADQRIDSWAYPALHHVFVHGLLCACPARNLVSNVGAGPDSTHFSDDPREAVPAGELRFPLTHPATAKLDRRLHERNLREHFGIRPGGVAGWLARTLARIGR